jgi:hypothetical protein
VTGSLPSWSPLGDPQLSAQIQAGLQQADPARRAEAQRDLYFLERYAWQEYPAKIGRWQVGEASSLTGGSNLSGPWTKREWTPDPRWVLLLDPGSRQPIAAHVVHWWTEEGPDRRAHLPVSSGAASVWFAGDPRVCGMFTPAGNGHRAVFGYRAGKTGLKSWAEGPARFEKAAPLLAAQPYQDAPSSEFGPWIADHPQQPPRPKRFSRAAWETSTPTEI